MRATSETHGLGTSIRGMLYSLGNRHRAFSGAWSEFLTGRFSASSLVFKSPGGGGGLLIRKNFAVPGGRENSNVEGCQRR
jgi:hypothetical protein